MLVRPSEYSVGLLALGRYRREASSRNWLPVQSSEPDEVPHALVMRSHYAVGRFLGFVVFLQRAAPTTLSNRQHPLFEFRLPPEY
jgi:hypothetical protein